MKYLLKVVDHEEDVWVTDLWLLPFAVHGVFAGRCEHFLWTITDRMNKDERGLSGAECESCVFSYLTLLLVDVDVAGVWARADGAGHHVVQLQDGRVFRLLWSSVQTASLSLFSLWLNIRLFVPEVYVEPSCTCSHCILFTCILITSDYTWVWATAVVVSVRDRCSPSAGWGSGRRSPPSRCLGPRGPAASWSLSCKPPPPPETSQTTDSIRGG